MASGLLVLAVLGAVAFELPRHIKTSQLSQVDQRIGDAVPVATAVALSGAFPRTDSRSRHRQLRGLSDLYVAHLVDGRRDEAVRPAADRGAPEVPPPVQFGSDARPRPRTVASVRAGGSWRAAAVRLPDGSDVLVAVPLDQLTALARSTTTAVLVAEGLVVLAMLVTGWWLYRLGLRPIAEVTEVADAIAAGDRGRRVHVSAPSTEAGRLAQAFNVMLDEQESSESRLRRFVADASHELRTPVTAIAGLSDLWREGGLPRDEVADTMRRIGREAGRMGELMDDLLLLASLDESEHEPACAAVDLARVAELAIAESLETHPSRRVRLEAEQPVVVRGDPDQLRRVVNNLTNNALVHTDSPVAVAVVREREHATLTVADSGDGLSDDEVARAFDRFWRAESARGRRGTGLGLPLVRSIVEHHDGRVQLTSAPGQGTTVRIALPLLPGGTGPDATRTGTHACSGAADAPS